MKTARKKTSRCQDEKRGVRFVDASEPWWRSFLGAPRGAEESCVGSAARVPCGEPGQSEGHPAACGKREGSRLPAEVEPLLQLDRGAALMAKLRPQISPSADDKEWRGGRIERGVAFIQRHYMQWTEWPDLESIQARCAEALRSAEEPGSACMQGPDEAVEADDRGWGTELDR